MKINCQHEKKKKKKKNELQIKSLLSLIIHHTDSSTPDKTLWKKGKNVVDHWLVTKMVVKSKHTNKDIIYICKNSVV